MRRGRASSREPRDRGTTNETTHWFHSLRMSGLTLTVLALVLIAAVVLTPSFSTYVQQQREIAQLRESVEMHRATLEEMEAQQLKWQDPVYIRAQARQRLYYVLPGEVQLTVVEDDVVVPEDPETDTQTELKKTERDWTREFAASILGAGTTGKNPDELFTTQQ